MNSLSRDKRIQIVSALVEGASLRSASRMAGVSVITVMKLLVDIGQVCAEYQDEVMRNLPCKRLQVDEIWSFCYSKAKNVPADKEGMFGCGDVWTYCAIDAETKLVPCWLIGSRDSGCATAFLQDLEGRSASRIQLTTDGHKMYLEATETAFAGQIDFAQLVKIYGADPEPEKRYNHAKCLGCKTNRINGHPGPAHVSTSYAERQHLTMRMNMRRISRPTAFSKKVENLACAVALHLMHYNFARIHKTLRCSPAMKAGIADRLWSIADIIGLLEAKERSRLKKKTSN